ncbi:tyrosine-type recombinase/integrase [Rhodanobacter sp. AS-Z3]|uniref:tyrosine-type recombinase/integrase n=1 Tax=Rhodanobacter sp. AS-Z3 TaxID=3031330 RepID=UPI002479B8E2|nr:tyrosine-type recombinase/integrase [Rhodanobacter sp. AS-Z3]WEN14651.1 tyrosine-type recombinase/integrase [Rhodanobacter sp. AS-Z3]
MDAYVGELRRNGKASAREVEASIRRNIKEPWEALAATPADDISLDDLLAVVSRLADADKLREAAKIRSYLQAAYNAGIKARQSAKASPELRALKITTNPARDLATIEGASAARERALSLAELRAYWRRIKSLPDHEGAALRFHLLTGGQRLDQLARVTQSDYDYDQKTITIRDSKGRRKDARAHVVPLVSAAEEAMQAMAPDRLGPFIFTVTAGEHGVTYPTMNKRCAAVARAMEEAGELPGGYFTLGDLRRTVETRLAAEGVSREVRAQLQSHGLGGVQARHYDRHEYLEEKREALETLFRLVANESAKVIPMRKGKRR